MFLSLKNLPQIELVKGFHSKMIHAENLSVLHLTIEKGYEISMHQHTNEQITNILEGQLEMTVGGVTKICQPGDVVVIPSNVPHSAKSITDCRVIDVFSPVRTDYKALSLSGSQVQK